MHLFISHSTKDGASEAQALAAALEQAGHRCWIAPRDVKAGVPYPGQIVSAIENAAGLVLLVTPGANESPDVLQEVQLASNARKTIAPVMLRATAPAPDLRYYIGVRHQIAWAEAGSVAAALLATFGAGASVAAPVASRQGAAETAEEQRRRTPGAEWREGEDFPLLVTIPAGKFTMGSPPSDQWRNENEGPQREVSIRESFALSKYPVTVDEFAAFVAETHHDTGPSAYIWNGTEWKDTPGKGWRDPGFAQTGRDPVCCVSWKDAQAYLAWLNEQLNRASSDAQAGLMARGPGGPYRLPTEAEWEYACRAGSTKRWSFSDDEIQFGTHAWFSGNSGGKTHPVGEKSANRFGLHDMHGNVWEWVQDGYAQNYAGLPTDGSANEPKNSRRVIRGGGWGDGPQKLRSADRVKYSPAYRGSDLGFRPARTFST